MATPTTTNSSLGQTTPCPFCNMSYRGSENHLRHCNQRNGRDYRQYLAPKTLSKSQPKRKMQCSTCKKYFVRLDTHLRRSAACRLISPLLSPNPVIQSSQPTATEAAMFLPLNSKSAMLAGETTNTIPASSVLPIPAVKGHLLLPKTAEGWEAANEHFSTTLVSAVLGASSLSEKYSTLIDGIYSYFQSTCGSRAVRASPLKKRRPLHNTSLKEVKNRRKLQSLSCDVHVSKGYLLMLSSPSRRSL